jgi:hypothetical protein
LARPVSGSSRLIRSRPSAQAFLLGGRLGQLGLHPDGRHPGVALRGLRGHLAIELVELLVGGQGRGGISVLLVRLGEVLGRGQCGALALGQLQRLGEHRDRLAIARKSQVDLPARVEVMGDRVGRVA